MYLLGFILNYILGEMGLGTLTPSINYQLRFATFWLCYYAHTLFGATLLRIDYTLTAY